MNGRVYLDHNATSPARPEVVAAMAEALAQAGNASSLHQDGRSARRRLESARLRLASWLGAAAESVIFTSGATEANDLALAKAGNVIGSSVEHASVLAHLPHDARLPVDPAGVLDLDALRARLRAGQVGVVALMLANNETGVMQPVAEAASIAHDAGALLHVDATQAVGRMPIDEAMRVADRIAIGAHKAGGPPGIGALVVGNGTPPAARLLGGSQERRLRAGTENVPAAVGIAALADAVPHDEPLRLRALRDSIEKQLLGALPELRVLGGTAPRLPNTSSLLLTGVSSEAQLMALDLDGIAVGAGAACSSGRIEPSHVLRAMGLNAAEAACAIRVSVGWTTTEEDAQRFVDAYLRLARRALARRAAA